MSKIDEKLSRAFSQNDELPKIVEEEMQEAYQRIRERHPKSGDRLRFLLKVAGFLVICFAALGASAVAVGALLSRYDRMHSMDEKEKTKIYEEDQKSYALRYQTSRSFTKEEQERYQELQEAYENDQRFPVRSLRTLSEKEEYSGIGVCLRVTGDGEENILYLPAHGLTDEEILEIIEYNAKVDYVEREHRQKEEFGEEVWETRLQKMTDEEVERCYLDCYGVTQSELFGGFCRDGKNTRSGEKVLSEAEERRYQEMQTAYRESKRIPAEKLALIERPEEYDGTRVAYCRWDSIYYIPSGELTEEDFLEIIDFETKANYSIQRIVEEINLGKRSSLPRESAQDREVEEPRR